MKKVAMIVFSTYPQDARVRREAEALMDSGMSVDIICLQEHDQPGREIVNGIEVFRINIERKRNDFFRYMFEYTVFFFAAFLKLTHLYLKRKHDFVHVHNIPDFLVFCAIIPKLNGAKIILDMHENMLEFFMFKYEKPNDHLLTRILKLQERISVKFADHIIVATPYISELVKERCNFHRNFTTVLNLSDTRYFNADCAWENTSSEKFRLIYPGSLGEVQGLDIAIKAIKLVLNKTDIPLEFHIYGDGSEKDINQLKSQIKELELEKAVKFHPKIMVNELAILLKEMDVGIVPKRNGKFAGDAISSKLFDFAAVGVPTIVSRTRGDSLYFNDSMVRFFEPGNERDLADCIIELYSNPELRQRLSANINAQSGKLNWDTIKRDFLAVFHDLVP